MSGVGKTQSVSVHKVRRIARKRERMIQARLRDRNRVPDHASANAWLSLEGVPDWARGVRVERIGPFCFAVIATEERGH